MARRQGESSSDDDELGAGCHALQDSFGVASSAALDGGAFDALAEAERALARPRSRSGARVVAGRAHQGGRPLRRRVEDDGLGSLRGWRQANAACGHEPTARRDAPKAA